jgi:hypothetical protein
MLFSNYDCENGCENGNLVGKDHWKIRVATNLYEWALWLVDHNNKRQWTVEITFLKNDHWSLLFYEANQSQNTSILDWYLLKIGVQRRGEGLGKLLRYQKSPYSRREVVEMGLVYFARVKWVTDWKIIGTNHAWVL